MEDYTPALTPIEEHGGILVKRDDLFSFAGVRGGKVRTCKFLAESVINVGAELRGLVTSGSRASPQINIVAHIARRIGVPCVAHAPLGKLSPELMDAASVGAEIVQHRAGYNNVIVARAREDAQSRGYTEIPFGMECQEAINQTSSQVTNLPSGPTRIVIAVGSGMSLAGVLWGLHYAHNDTPVLGVIVGASPRKRLDKWAPPEWSKKVELVRAPSDYHAAAPSNLLGELELDPHYEAKCLPFLRTGDLFWCVGIRNVITAPTPVVMVGTPLPAEAV